MERSFSVEDTSLSTVGNLGFRCTQLCLFSYHMILHQEPDPTTDYATGVTQTLRLGGGIRSQVVLFLLQVITFFPLHVRKLSYEVLIAKHSSVEWIVGRLVGLRTIFTMNLVLLLSTAFSNQRWLFFPAFFIHFVAAFIFRIPISRNESRVLREHRVCYLAMVNSLLYEES
ncbi:expressed unknown protein [Seminavis robusta]|uniref:Uncharacterized protein n=1 Tax=Seminavis robusta TaxID=568900 RepID=A0A9N8HR75_9STRA|nr:expressed unknown protein [Seminavis robusta]|eukprot:Sro1533_g280400.1 n/a (171) ;mRNA; f:24302-24814